MLRKIIQRRSKFEDEGRDEFEFTAEHRACGLLSNIYIELLKE